MEEFKYELPRSIPVPQMVSYKGLGRKAIYPKRSWFGNLFSWFFGNDDIPKYIYKFEITVSVPEYLRMGSVIAIDGVRWYIELKNGPNRYTIVNLSPVDETIFHFNPETLVFGLYAAVAEGGS